MSQAIPIKRALISVSNKKDIIAFANSLVAYGVEIISTGGTAKVLQEAGIPVIAIDQVTGFPEMMDGRVKTLHPRIHGGLLGLRDNPKHMQAMHDHDIKPIDLVCVNLYPFEQTIRSGNVTEAQAIEQIDIGGPSMIRSASKNYGFVTVVTDPSQYDDVCHDLRTNQGATSLELRQNLARAAFARTASYDTAIATWMTEHLHDKKEASRYPDPIILRFNRVAELRYGENPHQSAAVYADAQTTEANVVTANQLHGKQLSFNNLFDAGAALDLVKEFSKPAAAVIKHTNPCGCATDDSLAMAFVKAYAGDSMAAFGGIVALNQKVDLPTAKAIVEGQKFLEVIVAPDFEPDALALLQERWKNVRLLAVGDLQNTQNASASTTHDYKRITGGLLVQQRDAISMTPQAWKHVAGPAPLEAMLDDLQLAWVTVKHVKSNAITLVRDASLVGAGAGQMDRVESCKIAIAKANANQQNRSQDSVAASDAFFPFRDGPDTLIAAGIKAIVQPGGSKRDEQTIEACNEAGVSLLFTGHRHFRH